ncbi:MAG: magnesium/cobalt transporter CorA [Candidatus Omnitrophica bacterium]|nr:magnesium/cobalt transporter CorA [Candidatus Omnitrophota bacterium]
MRANSKKAAFLAPGSLVYVGQERQTPVRLSVVDYTEQEVEERKIEKIEDAFSYKDRKSVSWINVDGVHNVDWVERLGAQYDIHPLVMEDIVQTNQRPKFEDHETYLYCILKMLTFDDQQHEVREEQVSLIMGENFVLSFQEKEGDVFDPLRTRIQNNKGRVRKAGADYLFYALMDAIVDHYFVVLEKIGDEIEALEEEVSRDAKPKVLEKIYGLKREMVYVKKSIWPLRDVISGLQHGDSQLISDGIKPYLRDVYDHIIQVIEMVESFRDMISGLQDLYLSMASNRMNEVMKVLTIIATIFIPPTFVAGIYGMNFDNMPELHMADAYFITLGAMALGMIIMVVFFRRKGWF